MRAWLFLIPAIFVFPICFAEKFSEKAVVEERDGLRLEVYHLNSTSGNGDSVTYVHSFLVNVSECPIRIALGGQNDALEVGGLLFANFGELVSKRPDGKPIKEPESRVGLVELNPGQVARLPIVVRKVALDNEQVFFVHYHVDSEVGAMHSVWSGELYSSSSPMEQIK